MTGPTLLLTRDTRGADGTFGVLQLGALALMTAEDDWKDNAPRESCIPAGTYQLVRGHFPKHGETFEVTGVPGRSSILIHPGNTEEDTEGCILLGLSRGVVTVADEDDPQHQRVQKKAVLRSREAFATFLAAMTGVNVATLRIVWVPALP